VLALALTGCGGDDDAVSPFGPGGTDSDGVTAAFGYSQQPDGTWLSSPTAPTPAAADRLRDHRGGAGRRARAPSRAPRQLGYVFS
jgi:hypothetical protein